ncbi:MAG: bifunctional DNA-formamidopyrimidine glycosylase/DNA-(apurinic or apyrimidinic site) lyase [bacterium]|nr:bifunctional DNA-formamidopyrimidine glycosylase/DNA-(apurinic or apyrimidinic site) lyase [bacterium]
MPELPEVETIRLGLQKYLVGHTIEEIEILLPKMVVGEVQRVTGTKVKRIQRYGKGLVIELDNNYSIAIHIKMTGQFIYKGTRVPKGTKVSEKVGRELPNSATHVIFHLDKGAILYYNDIRQFGWIKIVKTADVFGLPFFKELGPELFPSSGQEPLTQEQFQGILKASKGPIKPLLMDQKKIGGIGNIYANDALYVAKIDPKRKAHLLSEQESEALFEALKQVLTKGLEVGGASEWQYVNALGVAGNYQNFFQVYGKQGKKCPRCGEAIKKIVMAGRGTFYCPGCQK